MPTIAPMNPKKWLFVFYDAHTILKKEKLNQMEEMIKKGVAL